MHTFFIWLVIFIHSYLILIVVRKTESRVSFILQMMPKKDLESLATKDYVEEVKIEELSEEGRCRVTWQCPLEAAVSYSNVYSTANGSKTLLGRSKTHCFYTETKYKDSLCIQPVFYSTIPGKTTDVKWRSSSRMSYL